MTMPIEEFAAILDHSYQKHLANTREVARQVFLQYVEPICKKYELEFAAGNGDWFLGKGRSQICLSCDRQHVDVYGDDLPPSIKDDPAVIAAVQVLSLETPGFPSNDLGSLVPNRSRNKAG